MAGAQEECTMSDEQKLIADRGFSFPLPFPFADLLVLGEYLDYLEGTIPSLHHVTLTEIEKTILEAWAESCNFIVEEENKSANTEAENAI